MPGRRDLKFRSRPRVKSPSLRSITKLGSEGFLSVLTYSFVLVMVDSSPAKMNFHDICLCRSAVASLIVFNSVVLLGTGMKDLPSPRIDAAPDFKTLLDVKS